MKFTTMLAAVAVATVAGVSIAADIGSKYTEPKYGPDYNPAYMPQDNCNGKYKPGEKCAGVPGYPAVPSCGCESQDGYEYSCEGPANDWGKVCVKKEKK